MRELVRSRVIACLNRDNESSLKLCADNFWRCDLLEPDDFRPLGDNEPPPIGPQVTLVLLRLAFPGDAERLAWA